MASAVPFTQTTPRWDRWSLLSAHPDGTALGAYLDGELPLAETARLEQHLTACGACRVSLAGQREVGAAVRTMPALSVPESLGPELLNRLRSTAR